MAANKYEWKYNIKLRCLSEENVQFWSACEEFRSSGDANMHVFAQKIYDDFVAFNAPKEVSRTSLNNQLFSNSTIPRNP
jgi:hypothetical protein